MRSLPVVDEARVERRDSLLLLPTIGLLVVLFLPLLVKVLPEVYFDVDPRSDQAGVLTVLGPVGAAVLNVLALLFGALGVMAHVRRGGRLQWGTGLLALLGAAACLWHMPEHVDNLYRGGAWLSAVGAAWALSHLAQHAGPRRLLVGALLALIVPLTLDALLFVLVEHPQTVAHFKAHEQEFLQARGWEVGSPQHVLYVRRLTFPDVIGNIGLSNVYASLLAALTLIASAGAWGLWRRGQRKAALLPGAALLGALVTLYLTHSRGGVAALGAAGCLLVAGAWLQARRPGRWRAALSLLALGLIAFAMVAVIARGRAGPPSDDQGERSLLFRYQYWQGAAAVMQHEPWRDQLLGVGPGQFKPAYVLHKNPLNPEEVTSTHNVLLDLLVMLGVGGLAWIALLFIWLWRAGVQAMTTPSEADLPAPRAAETSAVGWILALLVPLFVIAFAVQWLELLTIEGLLAFFFGAIGFLVIGASWLTPGWCEERTERLALLAAAAALLIHGQIEMTFFHEPMALLAFGLVGAAGAGRLDRATALPARPLRAVRAGLPLLALAIVMLSLQLIPFTRQQAALANAAAALREEHRPDLARQWLNAAAQRLPKDPAPYRWQAQLWAEEAQALVAHGRPDLASGRMTAALEALSQAYAVGLHEATLLRFDAQLRLQAGKWFEDPQQTQRGLVLLRQVMQLNPQGLQDALRLADALWDAGQTAEAATWYQQCLTLSAANYLDPAKQLSASEQARSQARLTQP